MAAAPSAEPLLAPSPYIEPTEEPAAMLAPSPYIEPTEEPISALLAPSPYIEPTEEPVGITEPKGGLSAPIKGDRLDFESVDKMSAGIAILVVLSCLLFLFRRCCKRASNAVINDMDSEAPLLYRRN